MQQQPNQFRVMPTRTRVAERARPAQRYIDFPKWLHDNYPPPTFLISDIKPRSASMSMVRGDNSCPPGSIAGNRRMSLPPKSPVDKTLPSPRLFLKFKSAGSSSGEEVGPNQGLR